MRLVTSKLTNNKFNNITINDISSNNEKYDDLLKLTVKVRNKIVSDGLKDQKFDVTQLVMDKLGVKAPEVIEPEQN